MAAATGIPNNSWLPAQSVQTSSHTVVQSPGKSFPMTTWLWLLWPPLILVMGTFGNAATVGILSRMGTGRGGGGRGGGGRGGGGGWSTMNMYLLALAISDLCVLYGGLLRYWLIEVFAVDIFSGHSALCKLGMWIFGTGYNNATYLLVALTLQRAVSVLWPHRVHLVCTHTTTKAVIAAVTLTSALLLAHVLYGYDLVEVRNGRSAFTCGQGSAPYHHFAAEVWVYVEILTFAVAPFLCLAVSNTLLACSLARSVREAKRSLTGSRTTSSAKADNSRRQKMYSTTVTVMAMSFVFLLFNLPLFATLIVSSSYNIDAPEDLRESQQGDLDYFLQGVITIMMFCNSGVNFYLYCLTGTRFRNELKECCLCWRSPSRSQTAGVAGCPRHPEAVEEF